MLNIGNDQEHFTRQGNIDMMTRKQLNLYQNLLKMHEPMKKK